MKTNVLFKSVLIPGFFCFIIAGPLFCQKRADNGFFGKAGLYKAKKSAIDYLSNGSVVQKFGIISDSIWDFAELGMQEFKSSDE